MAMRVLLIDDHPIVRIGLRKVLGSEPFVESITDCGDAESALKILDKQMFEIIIVDIALPGMNGLQMIRETASRSLQSKFIVLSFHHELAFVEKALEYGASGYILKEDAESDIRQCILTVSNGHRYLSKSLLGPNEATADNPQLHVDNLTPTENQVLQLLASYKTSREIADELDVAIKTVQNHRANIVRKLGLSGNNALLQFAAQSALHYR